MIHRQILRKEKFLKAHYGADYESYCRKVRRYFQGVTNMSKFAVTDTETTWGDAVMSIGVVIAETCGFEPIAQRYYILTPFKNHGGLYTYALYAGGIEPDLECSREKAVRGLRQLLAGHGVTAIFAYNALMDALDELTIIKMLGHELCRYSGYY
jgi:hypothetical protein